MVRMSAKLCECGCGEPAPIATRSSTRNGWIRGQPKRFIAHHHGRKNPGPDWIAEDRGYDTPCWIWQGTLDTGGYGYGFRRNGARLPAHRQSWTDAHGLIPPGLWVLHKCDVRSCVNPDHLFLGDRAANIQDRDQKGRHARGERHGMARLRLADVLEIRSSNARPGELARRYGVSRGCIDSVLRGDTWKDAA